MRPSAAVAGNRPAGLDAILELSALTGFPQGRALGRAHATIRRHLSRSAVPKASDFVSFPAVCCEFERHTGKRTNLTTPSVPPVISALVSAASPRASEPLQGEGGRSPSPAATRVAWAPPPLLFSAIPSRPNPCPGE
jgi:hypothetical protein